MNAIEETLHFDRAPALPALDASKDAGYQFAGLASDAQCFRHAAPAVLSAQAGMLVRVDVDGLRRDLSGLSDVRIAALGRVVPILLCGEESAFEVFWKEGCRISEAQRRSQALTHRIAAEEFRHEQLLRHIRNSSPVPEDLAKIVARTRQFFIRIASRDPALHFARIAALDSAVCIILSALTRPLSRAASLVGVFKLIRSDEARHVSFSREHAYKLGADAPLIANTAVRVRSELVALLYPFGNAFEDLGVDADRLLRRISGDIRLS
jgi:hypothetical protein